MSLFDELEKKLSGNGEEIPQLGGQQKQVRAALGAKSGKAGIGGAPGASSLGEQQAVAQGTAQLGQQQQTGALQGAAIAAAGQQQAQQTQNALSSLNTQSRIAQQNLATQGQLGAEGRAAQEQQANQSIDFQGRMKTEQLNVGFDQQLRALASERSTTIDNIFRDFERSNKELDFRKDAAQLEQVGFVMAMRDKAYVDELGRIAKERDLEDRINYKDEMTRVILGDQMDSLLDDLGFKAAMGANQREWNDKLATLNISNAIAVANAAAQQASQEQMIAGANGLVKGGIDYAYKYNAPDKPSTDPGVAPWEVGQQSTMQNGNKDPYDWRTSADNDFASSQANSTPLASK